MADDSPILGTTWVEVRPDVSKLSPAFDAAEKKAQGTGKVIENSLGTAFTAATNAQKKLETAVVAGSPRMQYSYYQVSAALQNLENQIKKTTSAGGTLTGDQVKQYATLKSKIEEITPAIESQRRTMIAARAELQAGIGVWQGWEAAAARALSDVGFAGAGQKFLVAGGVIGAVTASVEVTKKLLELISPESLQWYAKAWHEIEHAVRGVNRAEGDFLILLARIAANQPDAAKGWNENLLAPIQRANGRKPGEKLFDAQTNSQMEHYTEIERRALEYEKERADIMNNTGASDKYARMLKDLELREEGYTNALMKDGDALRKLQIDRDQELRTLERKKKLEDELEKQRERSFKKSTEELFQHQDKSDFFRVTPIAKDYKDDPYTGYLKEIETRMLSIGRAMKDDREQLRLLAREAATAGAETDIGKYGAAYREHVMDPGKGITRDEYIDSVRRRRQLLNLELQKIDEEYSTSVSVMLDRMAKKYGSTYDQIQVLSDRLVTDIQSNFESGFFNAITGNIKGVKDAFKSMLDSMLRDVINFIVRQEVQQLLKMLAFQFGGYSTYAGYAGSWISSTASIPSAGNVAAAGLVRNVVSASSFGGAVGSGGGAGARDQLVHISLEPGLVARLVSAGGEAGYQRVLGDFNDNGPMRLTVRRNS